MSLPHYPQEDLHVGSGQLGQGEEQLSCTLCKGSQLNQNLGR